MISAKFIPRFYIRLKHLYGLDARALSLMRIALALVLLFDLCIRASSLTAHYTETGAVPFNQVERAFWNHGYFSLFQFNDTHLFALVMFIITGIVYLFLLAGYKTKLFTFLAWVLLTSLQNCNTLILQGGDDLLRLILFWGIFLPWGNFYSFDSIRAGSSKYAKKSILSVSTLGYVILLFSVYFFTGLLKESTEWNSEGSALYYALSLDQMTWPLGRFLLAYPGLLKFLTVFVRWFEMLVPFLLLVPFKNSRFRLVFILCIVVFQLCISLTLFVGLFYLISLIALIGLLPVQIMDWFDKKIKRRQNSETKISSNPFFFKKIASNYYINVIKNSFLFFCIALCMLWNISTVSGSGLTVANGFFQFGYGLRFNQNWGMFAPTVFKDDGWYVMEGTTKKTLKIDINRNGAKADYTKPTSVLAYIKDDRWRKFYENYVFASNGFMRSYFCTYLIHDWNKNHADATIDSLKIIYMKEFSVLPSQKQKVTKEVLCTCGN